MNNNTPPTDSAPAASFKPAGSHSAYPMRYRAGNVEYGTVLDGNGVAFRIRANGDDADGGEAYKIAKDVATALNWAKSAPSLYAYAKAKQLVDEWTDARRSRNWDLASTLELAMSKHLVSMGWDGVSPDDEFIEAYRATALAQAEGRNP